MACMLPWIISSSFNFPKKSFPLYLEHLLQGLCDVDASDLVERRVHRCVVHALKVLVYEGPTKHRCILSVCLLDEHADIIINVWRTGSSASHTCSRLYAGQRRRSRPQPLTCWLSLSAPTEQRTRTELSWTEVELTRFSFWRSDQWASSNALQ